jgi:cysteine synthase A
MALQRDWVNEAIRKIEADFNRSADTHLLRLDMPSVPGITLYFKDESIHPTGSLKHRLARSLFLYALCNGWIHENTVVVEASSGSTAVSEAYFAQLLGLRFIAVMPRSTSPEKIALIEFYGGRCHLVETPAEVYAESRRLASETGGHFMDQFTYSERATDWRGNNNIAESIFTQLAAEEHPIPEWIVCGAGTGGTSATLGRYVRYRRTHTRICVVDPEHSVYFDFYQTRDHSLLCPAGSRVEGIGRPRVEASFLPDVVDRVLKVPDAASFAALRFLHRVIGRKCGGSTGTNLFGALQLIAEMKAQHRKGSVVTLICDPGERYLHTYYRDEWLKAGQYDIQPYYNQIEYFFTTGEWMVVNNE